MTGRAPVGLPGVRVLPMGERAVLLEFAVLAEALAAHDTLEQARRAGASAGVVPPPDLAGLVEDLVPAARTVLVVARSGTDLARLAAATCSALAEFTAYARAEPTAEVTLTVRYDGPDLPDIAAHTGLTAAQVVAAHTGTPWRVAFGGFAPGFAYLTGGDPRLRVPRRASPRTRVPAGAVGLAGEFSGIYPRPSPGGWQLLGTTEAVLWDPSADPPALLTPGAVVRFEEAR